MSISKNYSKIISEGCSLVLSILYHATNLNQLELMVEYKKKHLNVSVTL